MRSQEYLELFRVLEEELENKYVGVKRTQASIVMQYLADNESLPVREDLDLCREVRNILTHNAERGGEPVVEPSEALMDQLRAIIEYVKRPPLAVEFMTAREQLLTADVGQRVVEVMRAMERRGFSHVPVMGKGELVGVFSTGTVFSYCARDIGEKGIGADTRVRAFGQWLGCEKHVMEGYAFVDERATYADVKWLFERRRAGEKRLAAVFVTRSGDPSEPLLGMITPWDILRHA